MLRRNQTPDSFPEEAFGFRAVKHLLTGECLRCDVRVKGLVVSLHDRTGTIASGVWDAGKYVRYPYSQILPVHPQLLDEIDAELRLRLRLSGLQARRRSAPRESET